MTEDLALMAARVLAFSSLALSSIFLNSLFRSKQRISSWLGVFILAMGQIVLGSVVLSELHAISLSGLVWVHLAMLVLSILVVRRHGTWPKGSDYFPPGTAIRDFVRSNWLLSVFGVCVVLLLVLVVLPAESVPGDAAHYHLARAQYWIQNHSARHFFTDDYRQVEFPPNSSFLSMWQILVTGRYANLNLIQWLAAMLSALAIGGLSGYAGHNVAKSAFAGLTYLTLSSVVLQMATPLDDNLTAWLAVSLVYFVLLSIRDMVSSRSAPGIRNLVYSGIAFGLFMGTKLTSWFLLPAFGLVVLVLLLRHRATFVRNSLYVGAALLVGFIFLGAYNYALNWLDFGDPIASSASRQVAFGDILQTKDPAAIASARDPVANFVRYAYQMMDWQLVKPIPGADTAYLYNRLAYRAIASRLRLDLEGVGRFDLVNYGLRDLVPGADVGYGPIGYLVFLGSLVFLPVAVWRYNWDRKYRVSAALVVLGLGWLIVFCFLIPWTPAKVRYFSISFVFLVAAVVPFVYDTRRLAYIWLVPFVVMALWTLARVSKVGQQYAAGEPSLAGWQVSLLRRGLPADARVGTSGMVDFIYYLREFPEYTFIPIPQGHIADRLKDGSLDAVLADDPSSELDPFWLPFENGQKLLVQNPKMLVLGNLDLYGAKERTIGSEPVLELRDSGLIQRLGPDLVRIFLPAASPMTTGKPLDLDITFPVAPPGRDALSIACGGDDLEFRIKDSSVLAEVPAVSLSRRQAYLYCEVRVSDYTFGNQIPSDEITVLVQPKDLP